MNKVTRSAKEALALAFDGIGGVAELEKWAKRPENRADFYKLWSKLVPTEITGKDGGAIVLTIAERKERLALLVKEIRDRSGS